MLPIMAAIDPTLSTVPLSWDMGQSMAAGVLVGLSLGLTGGGGAIFAVPLLVYWIGIDPQTAVSISLVTVAVTAVVGAAERWWYGQVEVRTGLLFAAAGMLTAPLGSWLGDQIPPRLLLAAFAGLMFVIAARMWRKARDTAERMPASVFASGIEHTCSRDAQGQLRMTTRCFVLLALVGLVVGLLSGLAFATMTVPRAVGTSLFVMTLVGAAAVGSQLAAGRTIPLDVAGGFVAGSIPALFVGSSLGRQLTGPTLARAFAVAIILVAAFIIAKTLFGF